MKYLHIRRFSNAEETKFEIFKQIIWKEGPSDDLNQATLYTLTIQKLGSIFTYKLNNMNYIR